MTIWLALWLGCTEDLGTTGAEPEAPTPFEACDPNEIQRMLKKHAFVAAFDDCTSNQYSDFGWSTDGHRLHFVRGMSHYVLDAASKKKGFELVPSLTPIGSAAWVSPTRLVFPVGPSLRRGSRSTTPTPRPSSR